MPAACLQDCLSKMLLFNHLDQASQRKIVQEMYERPVPAGEILIQEGDTGALAEGKLGPVVLQQTRACPGAELPARAWR